MADNVMNNKFKPAFGSSENVQQALDQGLIDKYDLLLLDGNTDIPKIGWVDANGNPVVVDTEKIVIVESEDLPESGEEGKLYIHGKRGYFWNGTEFVIWCEPTDLTKLEGQVGTLESEITNLETQVETKVNEEKVQEMIENYASFAIEIVEF